MTPEDREEIQVMIENAFLKLPEITSKMIVRHYALTNAWKKFWNDNKHYAKHGELVASIVKKVDDDNPGADYDEIFKKAIPIIDKSIEKCDTLNTTKVEKPSKEERDLGVLG